MTLRVQAHETEIIVDLVTVVTDIGELTKLAVKLGMDAIVQPSEEETPGYQVRFMRSGSTFGLTELYSLAAVLAYAEGKSGTDVLDDLRSAMVAAHLPMDRPLQDVMEIGGGPDHEGHDHD